MLSVLFEGLVGVVTLISSASVDWSESGVVNRVCDLFISGKEDLPDTMDARSAPRLGSGQRRTALHEVGHPHR